MMLLKNDRVAGEEKECACVQGEGGGGGGGGLVCEYYYSFFRAL